MIARFAPYLAVALSAAAGNAAHGDDALATVAAEYRSVPYERRLDGVIEAVSHSTVSAQVSARVTAIFFDVNDYVEEGALLIQFDDAEYRARLRQATASRESAAAALDAARAHFARIESLYARQTASRSDFDHATAELNTARAQLDAAEALISQTERQLEYTQVRAPYSGIVTRRHIELGESATVGTPLMSGFSLDRLRAVVNAPQGLVSTLREHPPARILVPSDPDIVIEGEAVTVFPYAQASTATIEVRVLLPEGVAGVYPGMLVKVVFALGSRSRLSIPARAVVHRSEVAGVYVVDDEQKITFRHVRLGHVGEDDSIEILAGLDSGERVAMEPATAASMLRRATAPGK